MYQLYLTWKQSDVLFSSPAKLHFYDLCKLSDRKDAGKVSETKRWSHHSSAQILNIETESSCLHSVIHVFTEKEPL